jgi:hypothetical protein
LRFNNHSLKPKKIHRLQENQNLPFALIAISFHESLLKTAWNLNRQLRIDLRESAVVVKVKENSLNSFPVFCDRESSVVQFYSLISNKTESSILVKELPNIDYILEISGEFKKSDITLMIKEIKRIPRIIAALEVDPKRIRRETPFCPL